MILLADSMSEAAPRLVDDRRRPDPRAALDSRIEIEAVQLQADGVLRRSRSYPLDSRDAAGLLAASRCGDVHEQDRGHTRRLTHASQGADLSWPQCPRATPFTVRRAVCSRSSASGSRSSRRIRAPRRRGSRRASTAACSSRSRRSASTCLLRFEGGLVVRSHLRMTGRWRIEPRGQAADGPAVARASWRRARGRALERPGARRSRRGTVRPARPGRARAPSSTSTPPSRGCAAPAAAWLGEALQDQRLVAGIGNMWMAEALWAIEVSPWARVRDVSEDDAPRGRRVRRAG